MNMFARFDENPAMTLRVIKETKRYGRTDARTDNVKTVYPLQTKFAGGIKRGYYYVSVFDIKFTRQGLRMHIESRGLPRHLTCILKAEPGILDIKRHKRCILLISLQVGSLFELATMT